VRFKVLIGLHENDEMFALGMRLTTELQRLKNFIPVCPWPHFNSFPDLVLYARFCLQGRIKASAGPGAVSKMRAPPPEGHTFFLLLTYLLCLSEVNSSAD